MSRARFLIGFLSPVVLLGVWFTPAEAAETRASNRADRIEEANRLYEEGRLHEAALTYRELLATGVKNGWLHYNLGNALFRQGKLGEATLEYERASTYLPRFGDLRHNLDYARSLTANQELLAPPADGAVGFVIRLHGLLNIRESLIAVAVLWWLSALTVILGWLLGWTDRLVWVRRVLWVTLLLGVISTGVRIVQRETVREAMVIVPEVVVRTGPGEDFSDTFILPEGIKVRLEGGRSSWLRIRLPNGLSGWMPADTLGTI